MPKKFTQEEWIAKAKTVHKDKYDYSKAIYTNITNKIIITCPVHGDFEQQARSHLNSNGCPICSNQDKHLDYSIFIEKANRIHGNKYDYSKVIFNKISDLVIIICPEHGEFQQKAKVHMDGSQCHKCARRKLNMQTLIQKFNTIHKNKYDYSKSYCEIKTDKIIIICPKHGEFTQEVAEHQRGTGCPLCGRDAINQSKIKSKEQFIIEANKIHSGKYDYSNMNYKNTFTKISIICPVHGEYLKVPSTHLLGQGCPSCSGRGFNQNKPAYLYYLKITTINNQVFYKIGITNRTVEERFRLDYLIKIEIIKQKLYSKGQEALDWETKLKRMYKQYQYKGPDILKSGGNTELFTEDIMTMWYSDFGDV